VAREVQYPGFQINLDSLHYQEISFMINPDKVLKEIIKQIDCEPMGKSGDQ